MFLEAVQKFQTDLQGSQQTDYRQVEMEEAKIKNQLNELMLKSLDKQISDDEYKFMKSKLLNRQQSLTERRGALSKADEQICNQITQIGKLLKEPVKSYQIDNPEKKRELVKSMLANFSWEQNKLILNWKSEFQLVKNRYKDSSGGPGGNRTPASAMRMPRNTTLLQAPASLKLRRASPYITIND